MYFQSMLLRNFRNYSSLEIEWAPGTNIITGANAQGKSNLLEGINFLSTGSSFRGAKDADLISWGKNFFYAEGQVVKEGGSFTVSAAYSQEGKKVVKVNGSIRKKLSDFIGVLHTVTFSPEDLDIVKSSPSRRRKYLDGEMVQLFPAYLHLLWQYQKIVLQRNNLLKEIFENRNKEGLLDVWDEQLVDTGCRILKKRMDVLRKLSPLARLMHRKITGGQEELEIIYLGMEEEDIIRGASQEELKSIFADKLISSRREEINRRISLLGPHRDDLKLLINGIDAHKFGSQGQQRTVALSLKLAELELSKAETGEYPVLLLDDVLSELDETRREHLLKVVGKKVQTFITAADVDFDLAEAQLKLAISGGKIINKR